LIIDGYEVYASNVPNIVEELFVCIEHALQTLPFCRFFVSDLDIYIPHIEESKKIYAAYINESAWLKRLESCMDNFNNAYRFPLKDIVIKNGRNIMYSSKMWYLASNRFSVSGERLLLEKIRTLIRPVVIPAKKCLVLDMDNTLWGGAIGEEGIEGIQLEDHGAGARFYDFQKMLKEIQKKGVLITVISKNNKEDVEKIFSHPHMILQKNDFAAMVINWDTKSNNISQMAKSLNIGLDALVFVDDNPVEREEMRQNHPEVTVADFPEDTSLLPQFAIEMYNRYFYTWAISAEDVQRSQMYIENVKRREDMSSFSSYEDFLADMNIKLTVNNIDSNHIVRAAQMLQKTNQFNLTARKYTESEITEMVSMNTYLLLIGHVQDKYGDNGNSILLIARILSNHEAEIDSFLMSCRIMSRTVEFGFLYTAEKILKEMGIGIIYAKYIKTVKNDPAALFFDDAGYTMMSKNDTEKNYVLDIKANIERNSKKSYVLIEGYQL
jgi:FkbH-like protein